MTALKPDLNDALAMVESMSWEDFANIGGAQLNPTKDKEAAAKRAELAAAAARIYGTPDGQLIFKMLADVTLFRMVFETHFGLPADQVAMGGAKREGQNSLVGQLLKLVSEGGGRDGLPTVDPNKPKRKRKQT